MHNSEAKTPARRRPHFHPAPPALQVGTPFCVTVDFDTIEGDGTVTLRERDSTEQRRVTVDELLATMEEAIDG